MKTKILILLGVSLASGAVGYKLGYRPPQTEEKIIVRDVIKTVKETVKPDGTRETETRTEHKNTVSTDTQIKQPQWGVQLEHGSHPQDWRLGISRRIFGDFSVTASTNLRDDLIWGIRYEF